MPEKDKKTILEIDGEDIENPKQNIIIDETIRKNYYGNVIPRIERMLKKKYGKKTKDADVSENVIVEIANVENEPNDLSQNEREEHQPQYIFPAVENLPKEPVKSEEMISIETPITIETDEKEKPKIQDHISKEDYLKILEIIKTPTFYELMSNLNPKTAIIIALRLGYIDNKYFSSESIAAFLGIEELEVVETTTEILKLYKEQLGLLIDKAIYYGESDYARRLKPE